MDRQAGEFLQGLQHLAAGADEFLQGRADDGNQRPVALDVHVDVAVEIGYVEQPFHVVGRDLAFLLQVRDVAAGLQRLPVLVGVWGLVLVLVHTRGGGGIVRLGPCVRLARVGRAGLVACLAGQLT